MTLELDLALLVFGAIALGCLFLAIYEWFDPVPPNWVVKVRLWLHRMKE